MSKKLNSSCPICGGYLFDDDDMVYCPECGAPHHRDCYLSLGHCGCESEHGKEKPNQKDCKHIKEESEESSCQYCGQKIPADTKFCPYCGNIHSPNNETTQEDEHYNVKFAPFTVNGVNLPKLDPYGGLDKNSEIDGVKVKDIARFVGFAPNKVLPKFKQFEDGTKKTSWNWMALISPYTHTIFRKMGFATLMYLLLELTAFVLISPFYYSLAYMDMPIGSSLTQIVEQFSSDPLKYTSTDSIILAILGFLLYVGYRLFAALFNDILYKKHVTNTIKGIRSNLDLEEEYAFSRKGGVRPILSLIVFMLMFQFSSYIPLFIAGFLFT